MFELAARAGSVAFTPGQATSTWGVNGAFLGPTLRARRGEQIVVNVRNELPETTSMHWHGMELPARFDGGPHQPIAPGQTWSPSWRIDQPAATLWYHPHPHGRTERHIVRGLAGMFIIDEDGGPALPGRYGVDDVPLIVQDRRFDGDGQFVERAYTSPTGQLGDTLLVNGTLRPYHSVITERVRLRILNASTARVYSFGFADERSFQLIGTDGGLLAVPVTTTRIQLSPAERAEIVVSFRPGERVMLRSYPQDLGANLGLTMVSGGNDTFDVLELRAAATLARSAPVPGSLADPPRLSPADASRTRTFRLATREINGRTMDMDRIDEVVVRDSTEIWEVVNEHPMPHNFHVHGVRFQVLTVGGRRPEPHLSGWKDTVYTPPSVPVRLIMRFPGHADPGMPYMFHCHLSFHEDIGMMGQYTVVAPGQSATTPAHSH